MKTQLLNKKAQQAPKKVTPREQETAVSEATLTAKSQPTSKHHRHSVRFDVV